jgi:hypothetical protein
MSIATQRKANCSVYALRVSSHRAIAFCWITESPDDSFGAAALDWTSDWRLVLHRGRLDADRGST